MYIKKIKYGLIQTLMRVDTRRIKKISPLGLEILYRMHIVEHRNTVHISCKVAFSGIVCILGSGQKNIVSSLLDQGRIT